MKRYPPRWEPRWEEGQNLFGQPEQREEPRRPSAFDVISKVLLPLALAANAYFSRANPYLLVLFAAAALLVVFSPRLRAWIKSKRDAAHDRRVTATNIKRLRQVSREAGEFFDTSTSRSDFLPGIVQEVSVRNAASIDALHIAPFGIFQEQWSFLNHRIQHEELDADGFHNAANELTSLLRSYNSYCVMPVFHTFAAEIRETLTANEKSKLNGFQNRYVAFLTGYSKFIEQMADDFRTLPKLYASMAHPNPL